VAILLTAHELTKAFPTRPLFKGISFSIENGERVGLIGPNGAGKSTLLKILAGKIHADEGKISAQRGLRVAYLEQDPQFEPEDNIHSAVMAGASDPHDWEEIAYGQSIMSKLSLSEGADLDPETPISSLSGGWKKRVAIARELMRRPDLLLLDEPTNHLDVESIMLLEDLLSESTFATLTITHDRLFLQRVSTRIIELDRRHADGILSVKGDYAAYLEARDNLIAAQEKQETKLRNTLRRETEWLRRGPKARTTKQQARINSAETLRQEVVELTSRNRNETVRLEFQSAERNPKRLIEAKGISKAYNGEVIIPMQDLLITPKSRIGLIGANGCGKSTLIRMLTGAETPDTGSVYHADQLQIAYFEQNRESLDPNQTLVDALVPDGAFVEFAGNRVHVKGYLARFLFTYDQMDLPVAKLSGGEQARLLIAKLMLKKAQILILDEPTNDLDMATLDILEDVLKDFSGAVILVSHDRYFLDHVANKILAFGRDAKGNKTIEPFVGLEQWEIWHESQKNILPAANKSPVAAEPVRAPEKSPKKKMSFKDQHELENMEKNIKKAEQALAALAEESNKPANASNSMKLSELSEKMSAAQVEIDRLYGRWAELESKN
jgi:ATP-binding cassette subfamily F protein uup